MGGQDYNQNLKQWRSDQKPCITFATYAMVHNITQEKDFRQKCSVLICDESHTRTAQVEIVSSEIINFVIPTTTDAQQKGKKLVHCPNASYYV